MYVIVYRKTGCNEQNQGGSDEVWDRGTMFSQLAKRSSPGLVSGILKAAVCFLVISTLSLNNSKELRILSPPASSAHFVRLFDYFPLGKSVKFEGTAHL